MIPKTVIAKNVIIGEDSFMVELTDGRAIRVPYEYFPRLRDARIEDLQNYRLIGRGEGIHWENLDEDILVEGLLR